MNMAQTVHAPVTPRRGAALEKAQDALCRQVESLTSELKAKSYSNSPPPFSSRLVTTLTTPPREHTTKQPCPTNNTTPTALVAGAAAVTATDTSINPANFAADDDEQAAKKPTVKIGAMATTTHTCKEHLQEGQTTHDALEGQPFTRPSPDESTGVALKLQQSQKEVKKLKHHLKVHERRADQLATELSAALTTLEAEHAGHLQRLSSELADAAAQNRVRKNTSEAAVVQRDAAERDRNQLQQQLQNLKSETNARVAALEAAKEAALAEAADTFTAHRRQVTEFEETISQLNKLSTAAEVSLKTSAINEKIYQSRHEEDENSIARLKDELLTVNESCCAETEQRVSSEKELESELTHCKKTVQQLQQSLLSATRALADAAQLHDHQQTMAATSHKAACENLAHELAVTKSELIGVAARCQKEMAASSSGNSIDLEKLQAELTTVKSAFLDASVSFTSAQEDQEVTHTAEMSHLQAELNAAQVALNDAVKRHEDQQQQTLATHAAAVEELRAGYAAASVALNDGHHAELTAAVAAAATAEAATESAAAALSALTSEHGRLESEIAEMIRTNGILKFDLEVAEQERSKAAEAGRKAAEERAEELQILDQAAAATAATHMQALDALAQGMREAHTAEMQDLVAKSDEMRNKYESEAAVTVDTSSIVAPLKIRCEQLELELDEVDSNLRGMPTAEAFGAVKKDRDAVVAQLATLEKRHEQQKVEHAIALDKVHVELATAHAACTGATKVHKEEQGKLKENVSRAMKQLRSEMSTARAALADAIELNVENQETESSCVVKQLRIDLLSSQAALFEAAELHKEAQCQELESINALADAAELHKEEQDALIEASSKKLERFSADLCSAQAALASALEQNGLQSTQLALMEATAIETKAELSTAKSKFQDLTKQHRLQKQELTEEAAAHAQLTLEAEIDATAKDRLREHQCLEMQAVVDKLQTKVLSSKHSFETLSEQHNKLLSQIRESAAAAAPPPPPAADVVRTEGLPQSDRAAIDAAADQIAATQVIQQTIHDKLSAQTKRFKLKNKKLKGKNAVLRTKLVNAIESAKKIKASRAVVRQERNALNARVRLLGSPVAREANEREFAEQGAPLSSGSAVAVRLANKIW